MELIYIVPRGVWKALASDLAVDPEFGNKMLDLRTYGGMPKISDGGYGSYYVMDEESYQKAQRDCFKFFYRNISRRLPIGNNEIVKDRTIACNLMMKKFDMKTPETGSCVFRDASPYMARLIYAKGNISPEDYEKEIIEYAKKFVAHVEKIINDGNLFLAETNIREINRILSRKVPFTLPKIISLRKYDNYIAKQFLLRGKDYNEICEKVKMYSFIPVCLASDTGFENYVGKIVAETIFEYKYPFRIESHWARYVNSHIRGVWLTNPALDEVLPKPCRIVGKSDGKIQVLANDADAELGLPYSRDNIYSVDQSWLIILTNNQMDEIELKSAGLDSCLLI